MRHQELHCMVEARPSTIHNAGTGVFAIRHLPVNTRLGRLSGMYLMFPDGDALPDEERGYLFEISESKERLRAYIDGRYNEVSWSTLRHNRDENHNLLAKVNCSDDFSSSNVMSYQHQGNIYYRTRKEIDRNTELLVYYGDKYWGKPESPDDKPIDKSEHEQTFNRRLHI